MSAIDTSGVALIKELKKAMEKKGAEVSFQSAKTILSRVLKLHACLLYSKFFTFIDITACVGESSGRGDGKIAKIR